MVIGVLGGMGSYATLNFFKRYLAAFPAEKEWDRPRILIDNRCTMPSRVRAVLYGEKRQQLVEEMADSIARLYDAGCTHIICACGTSHIFLPEVLQLVPQATPCVVNILEVSAAALKTRGITEVSLLATEGSVQSGIYQKTYGKYGIEVEPPKETDLPRFRELIEAVKKNQNTDEVMSAFEKLLNEQTNSTVVLGCTEFPVLYSHQPMNLRSDLMIVDPLEEVLKLLRREENMLLNREIIEGGITV